MQAHHQIGSDFVTNMMLNIVKVEISIIIATIQATIHRDFCTIYCIKKLGWLNKKILERLFGLYEEYFLMLPRMLLALKESNLSIVSE
jgi:hypothetical protein